MTHRGGLSLIIIIWRIGGGGPSFLLPWGPKILMAALFDDILVLIETIIIRYHPLYIKHNYHHT
jgi:hypothetical protein